MVRQLSWVLAAILVCAEWNPLTAQIYRWDNQQIIPGTEGITLGPGVQLNQLDLPYARIMV